MRTSNRLITLTIAFAIILVVKSCTQCSRNEGGPYKIGEHPEQISFFEKTDRLLVPLKSIMEMEDKETKVLCINFGEHFYGKEVVAFATYPNIKSGDLETNRRRFLVLEKDNKSYYLIGNHMGRFNVTLYVKDLKTKEIKTYKKDLVIL